MSRPHKTTQQEVKYVYDLPYTVRKQLCNILDSNDAWERLGGDQMDLRWCELQEFRRAERCGDSPTNRLLQAWGQQNHTVTELFLCLLNMKHFQAMRALQSCVPEKYHPLFKDAELSLTDVFLEKKPAKGAIVVEPEQPAALTTGHHTVPMGHDIPIRPSSIPAASALPTLGSLSVEEKSSSSLSQNTSGHIHSHQNYSMEGACALDPSHYHNLQTLDEKPSNLNHCSSSKVPVSLLYPTPDMHVTTTCAPTPHHPAAQKAPPLPHNPIGAVPKKPGGYMPTAANPKKILSLHSAASVPKETFHRMPTAANPKKALPRIPSAASPKKAPVLLTNGVVERKINNDEGHGISSEVSCEDNNREELKSKSAKAPYDPDQDYLNKLEEKRAREAAREVQHRTSGGSSSASSNSLHTTPRTQVGASPTSPSQQHPQLQQQQQQQPSSRKISNVSDAESPYSSVPVIPYKELEEATALWSQHNLLGRGGFGAVYRGTWKNTEVAIKRIEPHGNAHLDNTRLHITQSLDELKLLQSYRHDNILQVYGYSTDHELYPCLVYQFMPHGSLEDRLQCRRIEAFGENATQRGPDVLGWRQRFRVALGTAGALQFLHTVKEKPLIHGDVKSANILLDQNYEPKLGDFGLAREGKSRSTSLQVSRVHGTKPYLPVDYLRSKKLSVKVDTYSFGIVLFEVCTGLRGYDDKRKEGQKFLWELVEESDQEALRDKKPVGTQEPEVFPFLFKLGKNCAQQRASHRPDMTDVFKELESFRMVMDERARARRISMGESSSGCSTPHLLQVRYDTAGSLHSPSTLPSFPYHFHHPPSSPSAVSTLPPSPSPGIPHSPVPPGTPHYYPHPPLVRSTYPGMVMNGQVAYHPRVFPPGSQPVWVQGPADMMCGVAPPHPSSVPKYYAPHNMPPGAAVPLEQQDPPSYSETMSQPPPGGVGAYALPIASQLSSLNMNSNSESDYSDVSESKSSVAGHTAQYQTPAAEGGAGGPPLPLLTALNYTSSNCS